MWKLANIVLIIFPSLILFILNIVNRPAILLKNFLKVTEIFLLVSIILILVMHPFDYLGEEYKLSIERWSHVVTGRVHGFLFLFYFLYASFIKKKVRTKEYVIVFVSGLGLYFIGLRAAILGVIILLPVILSLMYFVRLNIRNAVRLSLPIATAIIIILFIGNINEPTERLDQVGEFLIYNEVDDGAINARLEGWIVAWGMIKDSPFLGRGLGGYNSKFEEHTIQTLIKYPHNLFIELAVELGVVGWIGSFAILYFIIYWGIRIILSIISERKNGRSGDPASLNGSFAETGSEKGRNSSLRLNSRLAMLISIYFLVLFSLWLAMFSKEISSQILLWVSLILSQYIYSYQQADKS
jgi:O-antigen ligase